jgi:hypothetical protein
MPADLQLVVVVGTDLLHVVEQGVQRTAREVVAVKRDQAPSAAISAERV